MPYDVVGGGGGGGCGGGGGVSFGGRGRGGGICSAIRCCYFTLCLIAVGGVICIVAGIGYLVRGAVDTRGQEIGKWYDAVKYWNDEGLAEFGSLDLNLGSNSTPMIYSTRTITPKDFGESSWSTKKSNPPSQVTSALYSTNVCPNAAANKQCNFKIYDSTGNMVVQRSLTPNIQSQKLSKSSFCR